jgi:hypothetical protein
MLAASVGQTAFAQFDEVSTGGADPYGLGIPPAGNALPPAEFGPPPPPDGLPNANYQSTMTAWPAISPFDNRFSEHRVEDGLWHFDFNNSPRRYFLTTEAWFLEYRKPERVMVGNPDANARLPDPPRRDIRYQPATTGALYGDYVGASLLRQNGFFLLNTDKILQRRGESDPSEVGIRVRTGFTEPDNSGFELEAFWGPESDYFFQRGSRAGGTNFFITAGLPLFVGNTNVLGPVVTNVQFNRFFRIEFDQQAAGGHVNWRFTNLLDTKLFTLQPTVGARYLFVRERFGFEGIRNPSGIDFLGNRGIPRLALNPPLFDLFIFRPDVTSFLESDVESHMAGPQVGIQYDLGRNDKFHIGGRTDFGVMVNHEKLTLRGSGIGDTNQFDFDPDLFFHKDAAHTHVSPLLATSIGADMQVFPYIPIVRHWHLLDKARLSVGYSFIGVWEVSRPHRNIGWFGQPFTPVLIQDDRSHFYAHGANVGLRWDW